MRAESASTRCRTSVSTAPVSTVSARSSRSACEASRSRTETSTLPFGPASASERDAASARSAAVRSASRAAPAASASASASARSRSGSPSPVAARPPAMRSASRARASIPAASRRSSASRAASAARSSAAALARAARGSSSRAALDGDDSQRLVEPLHAPHQPRKRIAGRGGASPRRCATGAKAAAAACARPAAPAAASSAAPAASSRRTSPAACSRRVASSSSRSASAVSPANHSSPRAGSQPMPSEVTAGTCDARSSPGSTTGRLSTISRGSRPTRTTSDPRPEACACRTSASPRTASPATMPAAEPAERGGDGALGAGLCLNPREDELLAALGEGPGGGWQALALRQRAVEGRQPLPRELGPGDQVVALAGSRAGGALGLVERRARARRARGRRSGAPPPPRARRRPRTEAGQRTPGAGRSSPRLREAQGAVPGPPPTSASSCAARSAARLSIEAVTAARRARSAPASRAQASAAATSAPARAAVAARAAARGIAGRRERLVGAGRLECPRGLELGAEPRSEGSGRLAAEREPLASRPEAVERRRCAPPAHRRRR